MKLKILHLEKINIQELIYYLRKKFKLEQEVIPKIDRDTL